MAKQFHPTALLLSKRETGKDFGFLFKEMQSSIKVIFEVDYVSDTLIADNSGAITNGFTLSFSYKPTWCSSPIVFKLMRQLLLSKWNSNKKVLNCFTSFFRVWGKEAVYEHFDDELVLGPDVVEPVEPVKISGQACQLSL